MKLSNFDFKLPPELLAEYPAENRDEARLMVVHRDSGEIEHRLFKDLIEYFDDGDSMIINNTKVFPARMYGNKEKTGATIEVFLLRELNAEQRLWDVIVDPARKIRIGNKLFFGDDDSLVAEVIDNTTSRGRTLRFLFDGSYDEFRAKLLSLGETPLPKYIKRKVEPMDQEYYQTIYAKNEGAVAAPTARNVQSCRGGRSFETQNGLRTGYNIPGCLRYSQPVDRRKEKSVRHRHYVYEGDRKFHFFGQKTQPVQRMDQQVYIPSVRLLDSQLHGY